MITWAALLVLQGIGGGVGEENGWSICTFMEALN